MRYAVERCFEMTPAISEFRNIIGFRNILAHSYDHVDTKLVWGIIENDLEKLVGDLERLIGA